MPDPAPSSPSPAGRAFALPSAVFLPAACSCLTAKPTYSLLLTASLQSPRGVARVQANFSLTPLVYTAQDHSTAQVWPPERQDPRGTWVGSSSLRKGDLWGSVPVPLALRWAWSPPPASDQALLPQVSMADSVPSHQDLELLVYFGEPAAVSAVVEKGDPEAPPGERIWGENMEAPQGCRKPGGMGTQWGFWGAKYPWTLGWQWEAFRWDSWCPGAPGWGAGDAGTRYSRVCMGSSVSGLPGQL